VVLASGGEARRLTAHPAAERHPVWSRDGAWLAFASDRHGNQGGGPVVGAVEVLVKNLEEDPRYGAW